MQIIDKRTNPDYITFGELNIGDAFEDCEGDICIKTDIGIVMFWDEEQQEWGSSGSFSTDELVKPLEVTYTFERK